MAPIMSRIGGPCDHQLWRPSAPILAGNVKMRRFFSCRASCKGASHQQQYAYDLYELLGVERTANLQEIRRSYRWLQKKCHPDITGLVGHDMSILLNQAYTTLSDPQQRAIYDQSLAESAVLNRYTGCPLYSKWFGPAHEERAVFVDESRCVGCLKCALIAPNTFAIENRFGRARAIGQWADAKPVIDDAIKACPVDCISWIERSKLAAFEFVMSKEPRFPVGVDVHSNGGVRIVDVFKAVDRLLKKLKQQEEMKSSYARETQAQKEARLAAMEGVHARSGRWWYYFIGNPDAGNQASSSFKREAHGAIVPMSFYGTDRSSKIHNGDGFKLEGELHRLFEAATKRRRGEASPGGGSYDDEYWVPISRTSRPVSSAEYSDEPIMSEGKEFAKGKGLAADRKSLERKFSGWVRDAVAGGPVLVAAVAAWFVVLTGGPGAALTDAEVGAGMVPVDWMQSVELQAISVAAVWYLIAAVVANASIMIAGNLVQDKTDESSRPPYV